MLMVPTSTTDLLPQVSRSSKRYGPPVAGTLGCVGPAFPGSFRFAKASIGIGNDPGQVQQVIEQEMGAVPSTAHARWCGLAHRSFARNPLRLGSATPWFQFTLLTRRSASRRICRSTRALFSSTTQFTNGRQ